MKITELNLIAFGPFEDQQICLNQGQEGLHIIYGANEAGKSSTLRALTYWLYGFPQQLSDAYRHPYDRLRIGGTLRRRDGEQLAFIRRKGRLNTARDTDDVGVIEDERLRYFLNGIEKELFTRMFGIDHEGLIQGGKEIIQGGGDVGQILFAAGAGIADFHHIMSSLQSEADNLFRPAAQKPRINENIALFREKRKEISRAELHSGDWAAHDKALREAQQRKSALEIEYMQKITEKNRLERIWEALPIISERKECQQEYLLLKDAVILPNDFSKRRRELAEALNLWESRREQAHQKITEIHNKLSVQNTPERSAVLPLLQQADTIQALLQDLGSIRKADKDRLRIEGLLSSVRTEAKFLLKELRHDMSLDQAAALQLKKHQTVQVKNLAGQYEKLMMRRETTEEQIRSLKKRLEIIQQQLETTVFPQDMTELTEVFEAVQQQGDLQHRHQTGLAEVQKAQNIFQAALQKIPFWQGNAEDLDHLQAPLPETIDLHEEQLKQAHLKVRELDKQAVQLKHKLAEMDSRLRELELGGEIPAESDLKQARFRRDHGWRIIRDQWETGASTESAAAFIAEYPPASGLAQAYELSVNLADNISDRLRREADRVAQKAGLIAERENSRDQYRLIKEQLAAVKTEEVLALKTWNELWQPCKIEPKSPREMRSWLQKYSAALDCLRILQERKTQVFMLEQQINEAKQHLLKPCQELGLSFNEPELSLNHLMAAIKKAMSLNERHRGAYQKIIADQHERKHELLEAQVREQTVMEALKTWYIEWTKAMEPLGLPNDASTEQALAVMETLNELTNKIKEMEGFEKRIIGIDRDKAVFKEKVEMLTVREASDLVPLAPEQAVTELNSRLTQGIKTKTTIDALHKALQEERKIFTQAETALLEIQATQEVLCREAGVNSPEALTAAEQRSNQRQELEKKLKWLDQQIRKLSAGAMPEDFIQQAELEEPDAIVSTITIIAESLKAIDDEKSMLNQTIGSERSLLQQMDGSDKAAAMETECQHLLASVETDSEYYIRLKLAAEVLGAAIERYREKNQGPLLSNAEQLFTRMTLESYEALRLEPGDGVTPMLAGVRKESRNIVPVSGMSDGTADQLYLAIRLASLKSYLNNNEPLPFIVDDIMVRFDDQRSIETLKILAELSLQTQIIFFTHHRHLVNLAKDHIEPNVLWVHELPS